MLKNLEDELQENAEKKSMLFHYYNCNTFLISYDYTQA